MQKDGEEIVDCDDDDDDNDVDDDDDGDKDNEERREDEINSAVVRELRFEPDFFFRSGLSYLEEDLFFGPDAADEFKAEVDEEDAPPEVALFFEEDVEEFDARNALEENDKRGEGDRIVFEEGDGERTLRGEGERTL